MSIKMSRNLNLLLHKGKKRKKSYKGESENKRRIVPYIRPRALLGQVIGRHLVSICLLIPPSNATNYTHDWQIDTCAVLEHRNFQRRYEVTSQSNFQRRERHGKEKGESGV